MHSSIKMETPCEFINITKISPLISKCQIKVCYVGDEPNRNKSIITREVAEEMAQSLPGSPIVGYFAKENNDFEEHNRMIDVSNGRFEVIDTTRPYGFVDLNAKVWFQKFLDDGVNEHEYLMTEGYLWTSQYPECKRVIDKGNNQSMELDPDTLKAEWTKDYNKKPQFFIINEAIISKLCILGEECEPCFEGSNITAPKIEFSLGESFKEQLFSMMKELKELFDEGGTKVPDVTETVVVETPAETVVEDLEVEFAAKKEEEDKKPEGKEGEEKVCPECGKPVSKCTCEDKKPEDDEDKKKKYNLEEVEEYTELKSQYDELETKYNALVEEKETWETTKAELEGQVNSLNEFKLGVEKKEKEAMIASFYMLSDEDKKDVIENINTYSLDDIEAKLSIICVRNKVNFNLDDETKAEGVTTFSLDNSEEDDAVPAWIKAVQATADAMD